MAAVFFAKFFFEPELRGFVRIRYFPHMAYLRALSDWFLRFLTPGDRAVLKVQMALLLGASVLLSIGYAVTSHLHVLARQQNIPVLLGDWDGVAWLVWVLAAPAMLILIRRFPLVRGRLRRSLRGLLAGSLLLYFIVANLRFALRTLPNLWLPHGADLQVNWENYFVTTLVLLPLDFLTYGGFLAVSFAVDYYYQHRRCAEEALELQVRTAQLKSDLARAELRVLRGQLHPHFLFNSFNAVATLVRQDRNAAAVEVIAQLSMLLRLAIERTGKQQLTLGEEVDFVRRYLEIELIRFGDKLRLEFDVDPEVRDALLPNFVLQPLVENAIKHGISLRTTPGLVRVSARGEGRQVLVEIENDGPERPRALETGDARTGGVGLANTQARLEKIHGAEYHLQMIHRADGGTLVRLSLPWNTARVLP